MPALHTSNNTIIPTANRPAMPLSLLSLRVLLGSEGVTRSRSEKRVLPGMLGGTVEGLCVTALADASPSVAVSNEAK